MFAAIRAGWGGSETRSFFAGFKGVWKGIHSRAKRFWAALTGAWERTKETWSRFVEIFKERPVYAVVSSLISPFKWIAGGLRCLLSGVHELLTLTIDIVFFLASGVAAVIVDVYKTMSFVIEKFTKEVTKPDDEGS